MHLLNKLYQRLSHAPLNKSWSSAQLYQLGRKSKQRLYFALSVKGFLRKWLSGNLRKVPCEESNFQEEVGKV